MPINVIAIAELQGAEVQNWDDFDAAMAARQWTKMTRMGPAYCAAIDQTASDAEVIEIAQRDIEESAKAAGVLLWDGVCVLSDAPPIPLQRSPNEPRDDG